MKKRFGLSVLFLLALVLTVYAATRPTQGGSNNNWGTELNTWLDVAHTSDGEIKSSYITTSMITDNTVTGVDIANATIEAIDVASNSINATHLTGVETLVFGTCTTTVPAFAAGTFSNNTVSNGTSAGNCTLSGVSHGDRIFVMPLLNSTVHTNLSIRSAGIVGSNLSINWSNAGSPNAAAISQNDLTPVSFIVFNL